MSKRYLWLLLVLVPLIIGTAIAAKGGNGHGHHPPPPPTTIPSTTTRPPVTTTTTTTTTMTTTTTRPPASTTTSTTTRPPVTTTVPPTTTTTRPPPPPANGLHVSGSQIVNGSGQPFVPFGANLGIAGSFDWAGVANGHSNEALIWGWNTIRLNVYPSDYFTTPGAGAAETQGVIDEYTAKGIVVMVSGFPLGITAPDPVFGNWFHALAAANAGNSLVWYDCYNEPNAIDAAWVTLQDSCVNEVRSAGNPNIVVADAPGAAADASWVPGQRVYTSGMGPTVLAHDPLHNVLFSQHNYGGYCDAASEGAYLDTMHGAGLAVIIGEFGYYTDNSNQQFYDCAQANFAAGPSHGVGILAWHGTMLDGFQFTADSTAFYVHVDGNGLSLMGAQLWTAGGH